MFAPILILIAVLLPIYGLLVRPRMLDWGSTHEEGRAALPGDDLMPDATTVTTRAVTIRAPASAVWPWLVQMGQDRAGFYTHNWVERLLRSGIPDAHELHPGWQQLEVGDLMRTNRDMGGKPMGWPVLAVDPGRSIVVQSKILPVGTYAFVLQPIDDTSTRFLIRDRATWRRREWLFEVLLYEPLHAFMETGLLQGVKERVEGRAPIASDDGAA
jgi:hypothetical protein